MRYPYSLKQRLKLRGTHTHHRPPIPRRSPPSLHSPAFVAERPTDAAPEPTGGSPGFRGICNIFRNKTCFDCQLEHLTERSARTTRRNRPQQDVALQQILFIFTPSGHPRPWTSSCTPLPGTGVPHTNDKGQQSRPLRSWDARIVVRASSCHARRPCRPR